MKDEVKQWTQNISYNVVKALAYKLSLTEEEFLSHIARHFPIETKKYLMQFRLYDPWVRFIEDKNRIAVGAHVSVELPGNFITEGRVEAEGTLVYEASDGAFHIAQPEISDLELNRTPRAYLAIARKTVQVLLSTMIYEFPIYQFKDTSLKHRLARSMVKKVVVRNGKLRVIWRLPKMSE